MRDFTLPMYRSYLEDILSSGRKVVLFRELLSGQVECRGRFALLRHDVDRLPKRALRMARLERELGVVASYYFRTKPGVFQPEIIREIAALGHEIGYHYECLSDARGDKEKAEKIFRSELSSFSDFVDIQTIAMHGRPLLPFDNRDMWRQDNFRKQVFSELGILGELYLDVDYQSLAYISDTGRNWVNGVSNLRDKVISDVSADFYSSGDLRNFLASSGAESLVFQIHPERWSANYIEWLIQLVFDSSVNIVKGILGSFQK